LAKALREDPVVVQAVYEKGVLKPSQPLDLAEQQVVQISLNPETTTDHPITQTLCVW